MSDATVIRLRSRLDKPGRSHTSPKSTFAESSAILGAISSCAERASAMGSPSALRVVSGSSGGFHYTTAEARRIEAQRSKMHLASCAILPGGLYGPTDGSEHLVKTRVLTPSHPL